MSSGSWIVAGSRKSPSRSFPTCTSSAFDRVDLAEIAGVPLIGFKGPSIIGWNYGLKRLIDILDRLRDSDPWCDPDGDYRLHHPAGFDRAYPAPPAARRPERRRLRCDQVPNDG